MPGYAAVPHSAYVFYIEMGYVLLETGWRSVNLTRLLAYRAVV